MEFAPNTPSTTVDALIDTCKKMHKQVQKFGKFLSTVAPDENNVCAVTKTISKKKIKPSTVAVADASKVAVKAIKTKIARDTKIPVQESVDATIKRGRGRPKKQAVEK